MVYALELIKDMRERYKMTSYHGFDLTSVKTPREADKLLAQIREYRMDISNLPEDDRLIIQKVLRPKTEEESEGLGYMFTTQTNEHLEVDINGIIGARKYGSIREANGREAPHFVPKGSYIRNHRQLFAVSQYDCQLLSERLGVEITPELLGANLVIGREDGENFELTALRPGLHLQIFPNKTLEVPEETSGLEALLEIGVEQMGCGMNGKSLAWHFDDEKLEEKFAGIHRFDNRGLLLSLESPADTTAKLSEGQTVFVRYPSGKIY